MNLALQSNFLSNWQPSELLYIISFNITVNSLLSRVPHCHITLYSFIIFAAGVDVDTDGITAVAVVTEVSAVSAVAVNAVDLDVSGIDLGNAVFSGNTVL